MADKFAESYAKRLKDKYPWQGIYLSSSNFFRYKLCLIKYGTSHNQGAAKNLWK
jgi:hypothetical protein